MASVSSSSGGFVTVQIKGIADTLANLRRAGEEIRTKSDLAVAKFANLVNQEVQESIAGNRAEPKSVDTGQLANSIEALPLNKMEYIVEPRSETYPNGQTTIEVANFMEYGTSRGVDARWHFRNTRDRMLPFFKDFFDFQLK